VPNNKIFHPLNYTVLTIILIINLVIILVSSILPVFSLHIADASCITYEPDDKEIRITCKSAHLHDIYKQLNDESVLGKQSNKGVWLLNGNIAVANGATLQIDPSDTTWLKINSDGIHAYGIKIFGSLKIDSVKITSWNSAINSYALIDTEAKTPRPFITIERNATGNANITNSEIAYLGYNEAYRKGINYYSGNGSVLRGNNIHHLYFGAYLYKLENILIENNDLHHNVHYGIDPHTAAHNMIIRNNTVHDNGGQGIICSLDCYNIIIENNQLYNNTSAGIMFSRNMQNSIARQNNLYNEVLSIFVSASHNNKIYNNTVSNSRAGIYLRSGSHDNSIYNNTIVNPKSTGLNVNTGASNNSFYSNTIINAPTGRAIIVEENHKTKGNIFKYNKILVR
jgi:poly(beta-D-mannuronate) C5 epimerase